MRRVVSAIIWGLIGAVLLAVIFGGISMALPSITKDPSAAAATAVLLFIGGGIGLVVGAVFGFRRAA